MTPTPEVRLPFSNGSRKRGGWFVDNVEWRGERTGSARRGGRPLLASPLRRFFALLEFAIRRPSRHVVVSIEWSPSATIRCLLMRRQNVVGGYGSTNATPPPAGEALRSMHLFSSCFRTSLQSNGADFARSCLEHTCCVYPFSPQANPGSRLYTLFPHTGP